MTEFVATEVVGGVGYLTLTRPQALNALSLVMVRALSQAPDHWAADPRVVVGGVAGAGGKAVCVGGD